MSDASESKSIGAPGLRIRWVRSAIHHPRAIRQTLRGLGLHRLHEAVERPDTASIRGMIDKVRHLVEVTTVGTQP